jgi:micrococcal nuclease
MTTNVVYYALIAEKTYNNVIAEKVVDGDTVDLLIDLGFDVFVKKRVRLYGIDTPECRSVDPNEKKYGLLAKQTVEELLSRSDRIRLCCSKDHEDKYGRVLGELWVFNSDGKWINLNNWLCKNCLAVPYLGQNKENIATLHEQNRTKLENMQLKINLF